MNKGNIASRGQSPSCFSVRHGLSRIDRPLQQAVWPRAPLRSPSEDHVLGALFLYHGQAEEGGTRIQ